MPICQYGESVLRKTNIPTMIKIKNAYRKLLSVICSEVILLIYSFWCSLYYPVFSGYILNFILFLIISFIIYILLYHWRNLRISPVSFLRFFIICIQFSFFCYALRICLYPLPKPIYPYDHNIDIFFYLLSVFVGL